MEESKIIDLIVRGFDVESIGIEFDISEAKMSKIQQKIIILERYMQLLRNNYFKKTNSNHNVSNQEKEKILEDIKKEEDLIEKYRQHHTDNNFKNLYIKTKSLLNENPTVEQLAYLHGLIKDEDAYKPKEMKNESVHYSKMREIRVMIITKFSEVVKNEIFSSKRVEEIEQLSGLITKSMIRDNSTLTSSIKNLADRKKHDIIRNKIQKEKDNDQEAEELVAELLKEKIDKNIIKRINSKKIFNDKKTILDTDIMDIIENDKLKTDIKKPNEVIEILQEIGFKRKKSISLVINNMINRGEFNKARKVCADIIKEDNSYLTEKMMEEFIDRIIRAEIGYLIVKQINSDDKSKDAVIMQIINEKTQKINIDKRTIPIGINENNSTRITLEDIWYSDEKVL